jgi:hypothetical protein
VRRRELFKAAAAGVAALEAPRIGRAERASKLVFVPAANARVCQIASASYENTVDKSGLRTRPGCRSDSPLAICHRLSDYGLECGLPDRRNIGAPRALPR